MPPTTVPHMQAFRFEQQGDVLVVTLQHPTSPMNAVDELLHHEFGELFSRLRRDPQGRAIVLTAEGRAFSAGGDFAWFPSLRDTAVLDGLRRAAKQMIWDLLDIEVPIVCGLNGAAAGLGEEVTGESVETIKVSWKVGSAMKPPTAAMVGNPRR